MWPSEGALGQVVGDRLGNVAAGEWGGRDGVGPVPRVLSGHGRAEVGVGLWRG